jgi:glycolate oxidase iron-sulfur subunit
LRDRIKPGRYSGAGDHLRIGYFMGCGVDIIAQDAGRATFKWLRKTAKHVQVLDNCCCALPAYTYGDLHVAAKLAEKNLRRIPSHNLDMIVTDCASCASFLKKYPALFPQGSQRRRNAQKMASRVKDVVEVLKEGLPSAGSDEPVIATYHDPCHACRGQGIVREPREILRRIPGIDYVELPEAEWCCGGAGAYALSHYALSQAVLDRKMENVQKTGANLLVTACPACIIQLSYGVRKHGLKVRVCHISEAVQGGRDNGRLYLRKGNQ